jgi:hypothetical protein
MDLDQIDMVVNEAPEVRHVLQFEFLANSYAKFFLEGDNADYTDEEERLIERYREIIPLLLEPETSL